MTAAQIENARKECEEAAMHLQAIDRWTSLGLPRLSPDERDEVHALMQELQAERLARSDAHREAVARTARYLGEQVATHQLLLADAERRLERMTLTQDPETDVAVLLVPYAEARGIAEEAFREGYRIGRSSLRSAA